MSPALVPVLALALACTADPSPSATAPEPVVAPPSVQEPAPVVAPRAPVSVPSEPALSSFTGQATHLGAGLWCAFYPLGWSDDGRFAWATERRGNDMALEYGATWRVLPVGAAGPRPMLGFGGEDFPEGATLAWAWEQRREQVDALLAEQGILAGGTALEPLPADTPAGRLEARWELGELQDFARPAKLLVRWDGGEEVTFFETELSELTGEPPPPSMIRSPSGAHAVLVIPRVRGEPVEALVDVIYEVRGLPLEAAP